MENKAGIWEYVSNHEPVQGIIKYRYSDFIVNEINLNGDIVKLTSTDLGSFEQNKVKEPIPEEGCGLSTEQLLSLKNLQRSDSLEILVEDFNKSQRTYVHQYIKSNYSDLISSTTKNSNDQNIIRVSFGTEKRKDRTMGSKDHCLFVMYKENKSTMEAIESLCRLLHVKTSTFSFAGTKDKRAITSQQVTAFRVDPGRLKHLNKCLKNITLGNFSITKTPLKLGDLKGNAFRIILRRLKNDLSVVEQAMETMKGKGFINYFGTQRFGSTEVCNSLVGRCIIKSDWMGAIDLIMKTRDEENAKLAACREEWAKSNDPHKALEALGTYRCIERKLLDGLCKYSSNNRVAALSMLPRNMRLMYLHAYQSLLWNKIASKRIQKHSLNVLLGDLYETKEGGVQVVGEETIGDVSIEDVVIPMVGHDVLMPDNEVKVWITDLLSADQLTFESFKHKIRDYCLSGGYRKLIVKPKDFEWQVVDYSDDKEKLLETDLDSIEKDLLTENSEPAASITSLNEPSLQQTREPSTESKENFKALKLSFSLPSSSYATMLLREIVKVDTSSSHQSTLN